MYDQNFLLNNEFLKDQDEEVLEPFLKCLNRKFIIMYAEYLIKKGTPFSMTLIDIDNFKLINDSYGHLVGDQILLNVTSKMMDYFDESTIVGRYGGDEFLIINTKDIEYDDIWNFLKGFYQTVFRHSIQVEENLDILTTITSGSVVFPKDGNDYNALFEKSDKALYRGKQKGRNCFIIYVDEKHKNIDINKRFLSLPYLINETFEIITKQKDYKKGLRNAFSFICNTISCTKMALQINGKNLIMYSKTDDNLPSLNDIIDDSLFDENKTLFVNDYSSFKYYNKVLHSYCWNNKIKSLAILKLNFGDEDLGYLVCVDSSIKRIWQQTDTCIFQFIAKMASTFLHLNGDYND